MCQCWSMTNRNMFAVHWPYPCPKRFIISTHWPNDEEIIMKSQWKSFSDCCYAHDHLFRLTVIFAQAIHTKLFLFAEIIFIELRIWCVQLELMTFYSFKDAKALAMTKLIFIFMTFKRQISCEKVFLSVSRKKSFVDWINRDRSFSISN